MKSPTSPRVSLVEKPTISIQGPDSNVGSSSKQFLTPRRAVSPAWKKRTPEPPAESPLPAVVPDLLLARTDSGKTNTDVSESTTTTDDYITANSGTDSSRKSSTRVSHYLKSILSVASCRTSGALLRGFTNVREFKQFYFLERIRYNEYKRLMDSSRIFS